MEEDVIVEKLIRFVTTMGLSEESFRKLIRMGKVVEYKRKEFFLQQGAPCQYVGLVLKGDFRFSRCTLNGQERIIGYNIPYEFMTDYPAFLHCLPANYTIVAASDSLVCRFSYEQVIDFFELNVETQRFGRHIAEMLMMKREKMLLSFYFETPEERYLMIMRRCKKQNKQLNLKEIASIVGVTPETISHIRKRLLLRGKS